MIKRGVIVARIKPGAEEEVAKIFAESDATELPKLAGVRHRSLFVLGDIYVHYVETDDEFAGAVDAIRDNPLFKEISAKLDAFISPYDPETWRSPKDAQAREFYSWQPPG
jgi:cyclase